MISNEAQLNATLATTLVKVLNDVTKHYHNRLIEIIDTTVYAADPDWYTRTQEFRDSWMADNAEVVGSIVQSAIFQDPFVMKWNAPMFQHGNINESLEDRYNNPYALSRILNNGTSNAGYGFYPVEATHFWDIFIKELEITFDSVFQAKCQQHGLTAAKGGFTI